jgi:hypothetical protein
MDSYERISLCRRRHVKMATDVAMEQMRGSGQKLS